MSKRRRSELSKAMDWRLKTYSIAAMAAGVGALALAQPAEGEVVITRKKIPIPVSSYFFPPPHPVFISLNNNGVNDLSFSLYSFAYHSRDMDLTARPLAGAAVEGKDQAGVNGFSHFYASMLIERRVNLKRIQYLMGHEDIKTTLNTYGHLIERAEAKTDRTPGLLASMS